MRDLNKAEAQPALRSERAAINVFKALNSNIHWQDRKLTKRDVASQDHNK